MAKHDHLTEGSDSEEPEVGGGVWVTRHTWGLEMGAGHDG